MCLFLLTITSKKGKYEVLWIPNIYWRRLQRNGDSYCIYLSRAWVEGERRIIEERTGTELPDIDSAVIEFQVTEGEDYADIRLPKNITLGLTKKNKKSVST